MKACRKLLYAIVFFIVLYLTATIHSMAQSLTKTQVDSLFQVAQKLADAEPSTSYPAIRSGYDAAMHLQDYRLSNGFKILASYYFSRIEQLDTAEHLLKECGLFFDTNKKGRKTAMYGVWHLYSGYWYLKKKDFAASKARYTEALQFFQEMDDRRHEAAVQRHLGALSLAQADNPEALGHFIEAYQIKLGLNQPPASLHPELWSIASIYHRMGLNEKALEYGKTGLRQARESADTEAEADMLLLMGAAHYKLGTTDSAFLLYDQAYGLARANDLPRQAYDARYSAASAYSDLSNYELSNKLIREIQADPAFGHLGTDPRVGYLLGKNYLHTFRYDSSIFFASPAFRQAQEQNDITLISLASSVLAEAYEQKKDIKNALLYSRAYHAVQDTLFSQAQQTSFNELHARLETMEQESQKIAIEKEAAHDKLVARIWLFAAAAVVIVSVLTVFIVIGWYKNEEKKKKLKELQLKSEIDLGQSKLYKQTLHMIHVNNNLEQLEAELRKIKADMPGKSSGIDSIISTIHATKSLDKEWEKFDNYFARVHFSFYEGIVTKYPQLSSYELRICSLLKLGLSNKEIATIMGIEQKSIRMAKYRLKKKLGLGEEEDVDDFLLMSEKEASLTTER